MSYQAPPAPLKKSQTISLGERLADLSTEGSSEATTSMKTLNTNQNLMPICNTIKAEQAKRRKGTPTSFFSMSAEVNVSKECGSLSNENIAPASQKNDELESLIDSNEKPECPKIDDVQQKIQSTAKLSHSEDLN